MWDFVIQINPCLFTQLSVEVRSLKTHWRSFLWVKFKMLKPVQMSRFSDQSAQPPPTYPPAQKLRWTTHSRLSIVFRTLGLSIIFFNDCIPNFSVGTSNNSFKINHLSMVHAILVLFDIWNYSEESNFQIFFTKFAD